MQVLGKWLELSCMCSFKCPFLFQAVSWPNGMDKPYLETIDLRFCSFTAIIASHKTGDKMLPAAVKWRPINDCVPTPKWHIIPSPTSDNVNLSGQAMVYDTQREALLARYFCNNLLRAIEHLTGEMEESGCTVLVPISSSQGLREQLTKDARLLIADPVPGLEGEVQYLKDKNWWSI